MTSAGINPQAVATPPTATASPSPTPGSAARWRRLAGVVTHRSSWLLLAVVVVAALAIGSAHRGPVTSADRISYLEGVIKCPVCEDVSIAQSDAQQAVNLRAEVVQLVEGGSSNAQVERRVVAQFGSDEILRPTSPVIWILPIVAGAIAVAALGVILFRRRNASPGIAAASDDEAIVAVALGDRGAAGGFGEPDGGWRDGAGP